VILVLALRRRHLEGFEPELAIAAPAPSSEPAGTEATALDAAPGTSAA
jgi:hypothetical protein